MIRPTLNFFQFGQEVLNSIFLAYEEQIVNNFNTHDLMD